MVKVLSKPSCVQCTATHKYLKQNNVEFESIDMTEDDSALEYAKSLGYLSAPVVITDSDHWSGFRPDKLSLLVS